MAASVIERKTRPWHRPRVRSIWLAMAVCIGCGGEIDATDAGTCAPNEHKDACPCTAPLGTIENGCACAVLSGCDGGTRWACYELEPSCPATKPTMGSACTTANLECDYVVADGTADGRFCSNGEWDVMPVTTSCL